MLEALLALGNALSNQSIVLGLGSNLLLHTQLLDASVVTLALEALRGNETLDLGGLGVRLGALLLRLDRAAHNVLAHIVVLRQVEELADVCGQHMAKVSTYGWRAWDQDASAQRSQHQSDLESPARPA